MKNKLIYLYIAALLGVVSCSEDFLDNKPITIQTAQGYFQTPKNALEGLAGCYNGLVLDGWANMYFISTIASDEAFAGGGPGEAVSGTPFGWDEFKEAGALNQNLDIWKNRYTAIFRCNSLLENLGTVDWGENETLAVQYEAETRFLRAYYYFDLVRFFGNVPLVRSSVVELKTPQADPDSVYTLIAKDLKFAADNLPDVPYESISSSSYGHATKWAAESLMARVFLFYTGRYSETDLVGLVSKAEALAYVEDVINNSGHDLVSGFQNLWPVSSINGSGTYAGEDNKETVFAIKYTWGPAFNAGSNHWLISMGLRWHDGTPYPYSWGWGQAIVTKKYGETVFESGDLRKNASVISVADELLNSTSTINQDGTINPTGAAFNADGFGDYTGYFNKKYVPLTVKTEDGFKEYPKSLDEGNNAQADQLQDWVIIRYADVLLMAAELGSPNAQTYLDRIRDRAFGDQAHRVAVSVDNIRKERQLEFAFEGVRYWDLLRYGSSVAAQEINMTEVVKEGGVNKTKNIVFDTQKDGLFQIPRDEIDKSVYDGVEYLIQNPGW
ncbi:RagB/SusD family nutrient uptake outer membrane protein [Gaoshiqia sp. Z1-71]|uniref:RagB/SusD family nutrient uptake outer membrane protein n=1 Tax=Gaoshiqia hydrogeniformans TaxID=3290090 RepID=UPI003BF7C569